MLNVNHKPLRFDPEGLPVPLFWRYKGRHASREPSFLSKLKNLTTEDVSKHPWLVGLFAVVAVGGLSTLINSTPSYSDSSSLSDQEVQEAVYKAENNLQANLAKSDNVVAYKIGVALSVDGKICVYNPVVTGPNNSFLAMIGRANVDDPNTTGAAVVGNNYASDHELMRANVHWSNKLGTFVTSENVSVGVGEPMSPGRKCGV